MSVNFFRNKCQDNFNDKIFGICDQPNKRPAFVNTNFANRNKWVAVIINKQKYNTQFVAIDFCVLFPRVNGKKVKRCDAAIFYNSTVTFIELKERSSQRKWLADGEQQLKNTIKYFEASEDSSTFPIKRAYIANSKKPFFNKAYTRRIDEFFDDTKYILRIQNSVILE